MAPRIVPMITARHVNSGSSVPAAMYGTNGLGPGAVVATGRSSSVVLIRPPSADQGTSGRRTLAPWETASQQNPTRAVRSSADENGDATRAQAAAARLRDRRGARHARGQQRGLAAEAGHAGLSHAVESSDAGLGRGSATRRVHRSIRVP